MKTLHINTISKILKDKGFVMSNSFSNGRISHMVSSNGDISLQNRIDNSISISSRKGNLKKALSVLKKAGFKSKVWSHPSGISKQTIITN